MKLGDGVEQAIHAVAVLGNLPPATLLSAAALAEFHGVSTSYLLKHLQSLSKAGILRTEPGPKGGYCLARSADTISLLDIVLAVEGPEPAFRCREIRQQGPDPLPPSYYKSPCLINKAMLRAEQAYRQELRQVMIADLLSDLHQQDDGSLAARGCAFFDPHLRPSRRQPPD